MTTCLTPNCRRPPAKRGLCLVCYSRAKRAVESGKVTWDKLEEIELILPSDDLFTAELDKRLKECGDGTVSGDHQ